MMHSLHDRMFSEETRPFTVNPVRGVRAWVMCFCGFGGCTAGTLLALNNRTPWHAGENVAQCIPLLDDVPPPSDVHVIAGAGCTCGFYAYFDGNDRHVFRSEQTVLGVVEGYGVANVGAFGFRASKARIVALVRPEWTDDGRSWHGSPNAPEDLDEALAAYGVPVYATLELALEAHPLSRPEDFGVTPPTPEERAQVPGGAATIFYVRNVGQVAQVAATRLSAGIAAVTVNANQASAGIARLMAALKAQAIEEKATRERERRAAAVRAAGTKAKASRYISSQPHLHYIGGSTKPAPPPPAAPAIRKSAAELAAERRQAAGLRNVGGFDKRGRRR